MTREEAIQRYGVDPEAVGVRYRGWWIITEVEDEEVIAGATVGDLCVKTRDGSDAVDVAAVDAPTYVGSVLDSFDPTYRYYYFRANTTEDDR